MNVRFPNTPFILKWVHPNLVWNINTSSKTLYLTFDDGPTAIVTDRILDILKSYQAKATFFCIGNNVIKNSLLFKRIIDGGHTVGNHTKDHLKGWQTKTESYIDNILETEEIFIKNSCHSKLFRPPYGKIKPDQARRLRQLNFKVVMWDVLSYDWDQQIDKKQVVTNVLSHTKPGSIIVFHDSEKASTNMLYALPKVLDHFSNLGYKFESLDNAL